MALLLTVALITPAFAVKPKPKPIAKKQPVHAVKKDVNPKPKEAINKDLQQQPPREGMELEREHEFGTEPQEMEPERN